MKKRFYIIIIDSGWPTVAHEVLQKAMRPLKHYLGDHSLIIFSEEESRDFLKEHQNDIDDDPIMIITDVDPQKLVSGKEGFKGLRIDLGKVHDEDEVVKYLRQICQLIKNERFIADISWEERKKVAHAFIKDILGDVFLKFLELMA